MNGVVTGAASGIGLAAATRLAEDAVREGAGAHLVLVDRSREGSAAGPPTGSVRSERTQSRSSSISSTRSPPTRWRGRAASGSSASTCSSATRGSPSSRCSTELDLADYERTFAINTRATWLLAKALHPLLRAARGAIVATASIAAEEPSAPMGAYSASKAALVMLVRQMAYEWGPDGIRCNCVSPGMTHTGLTDGTYSDPVKRAERAAQIPLRRVADPEDIASVIAFLAGPDAAYVTGINLVVDGGVQTSLLPTIRGLVGV